MKKILLFGFMVLGCVSGVRAETLSGQVISVDNGTMAVRQSDGTVQTVQVNDDTAYREKKVLSKDKMKHGKMMHQGDSYFQPLAEEDDWVEIIYTPGEVLIAQDVVVYDD